jgi:acylphosphatase
MIRYKVIVTGKVQGVFFRKYALQKVTELRLEGWVCNQPDGTVLCMAQGTEETVLAFVEWCATGSPSAAVTAVHTEVLPVSSMPAFHIR